MQAGNRYLAFFGTPCKLIFMFILMMMAPMMITVKLWQVCNGRSFSRGQCEDGSDEEVDCCLEQVLSAKSAKQFTFVETEKIAGKTVTFQRVL